MNYNRTSRVVIPSLLDPITISDLKNHLRLDTADDDSLLSNLISASTKYAEELVRMSFIEETRVVYIDLYQLNKDNTRYGIVELPISPLISVDFINIYSSSNTPTLFDAANYYVDTISIPGRIALNQGVTWPSDARRINSVQIQYKVGFGASAATCPPDIKQALLIICSDWYENRTTSDTSDGANIGAFKTPTSEATANRTLSRYRVMRL